LFGWKAVSPPRPCDFGSAERNGRQAPLPLQAGPRGWRAAPGPSQAGLAGASTVLFWYPT